MIGAYVRVSSKSQTAAMQRDAIHRAATARGESVAHWYEDKITGETMQRPDLERLRADVRQGNVRKLYVWRLDRLTRSGIRDTLAVIDEFNRHGCELATLADGFDVSGPAAEVVLSVLAWAAKIERLAIGERIVAARVRVEANGGAWGRPRRMTAEQVAKAHQMRADDWTIRDIAVALKIPRATVAQALSRKPPDKSFRPGPPKRREKTGHA